jgi:hypothetical protein
MSELMNATELGKLLHLSKRSVQELCRSSVRQRQKHPLPLIRIHSRAVRFLRADVEAWILKLKEEANNATT